MEQEGEGREGNNRQPLQQQRCPRCDSMNTKFCYYNNYSLSQPRYFCKACKRYWTQGGTFRNIPIGGSSRKGKGTKRSSSSSMSQLQQTLLQEVAQNQPNMTTSLSASLPLVVHLNNPSQPLNQSLEVRGDDVVASSNSPLLSGFNSASLLGSQRHHLSQIHPSRLYQIENRDNLDSLYTVAQGVIPPSVANNGVASRFDRWPQSFICNANNRAFDSSLWSTISTTTSISGNSDQNNIGGGGDSSSLIPNHWPYLPGYVPAQ